MPRYQSYRADCGPSALGNALEALEHVRSHDELITLCGTTADGTTPTGLKRAIDRLRESCDLRPGEMRDSHADIALLRLGAVLAHGRPAVLLVDGWGHWVAAVGRLGDTFVVADSAHLRQVVYLPPSALAARWGHPGVTRGAFYGLVL